MKVFNLENSKGVPITQAESIVIATSTEWRLICQAVEEYAKAHPKSRIAKSVNEDLGNYLAVL